MFVNGLAPETISQPSPAAAGQNGSANVSFIEFHQQSSPLLSGQSQPHIMTKNVKNLLP